MTDQHERPETARPSTPPAGPASTRSGPSVPLKWVVTAIGALIVLALTFYAGMAYEDHRIKKGIEEAFAGFGDLGTDTSGDGSGDEVEGGDAPEPVELTEGTPVEVTGYEGTFTYTLLGTETKDEAAVDDTLTRNLAYHLRIENTGDTEGSPSTSTHYETDDGQVLEFAGVFCDEDSLPSDTIGPGQFVEGCDSSDIPDESGRLVFDSVTPELYLTVPAA